MDLQNVAIKVSNNMKFYTQQRKTLDKRIEKCKTDIITVKDKLLHLHQKINTKHAKLDLNNITTVSFKQAWKNGNILFETCVSSTKEIKQKANALSLDHKHLLEILNKFKNKSENVLQEHNAKVASLEKTFLEKQLEFKKQINCVDSNIEKIRAEFQSQEVEIDQKQSECELIKEDFNKIQAEVDNKQAHNANVIEELENSLETTKKSINEGNESYDTLVSEMRDKNNQIEELEENCQLQKEYDDLSNKYLELNKLNLEKQLEKNKKNTNLNQIIDLNNDFINKYSEKTNELIVLEKVLEEKVLKFEEYRKNIDQYQEENCKNLANEEKVKKDYEQTTKELEEVQHDLEQQSKLVSSLESELSHKNNKLFKLNSTAFAELKILEEKTEELEAESNTQNLLEDEINVVQSENKELQESTNNTKEELEHYDMDYKSTINEIETKTNEIKSLNDQIANISNEIKKLQAANKVKNRNLVPHPPLKKFALPNPPVNRKRQIVEESDSSVEGEKMSYAQFMMRKKAGKKTKQ